VRLTSLAALHDLRLELRRERPAWTGLLLRHSLHSGHPFWGLGPLGGCPSSRANPDLVGCLVQAYPGTPVAGIAYAGPRSKTFGLITLTGVPAAYALHLSPRTIDYHLRKVITKLGLASRIELTQIDFQKGAGV
jgi:hypothetical protein